MIDIDTFASEDGAQFYLKLLNNHRPAFEHLFALLNNPENEQRLIDASTDGRPALDGVVSFIEDDQLIPTILRSDHTGKQFRKSVGFAVRIKWLNLGGRRTELGPRDLRTRKSSRLDSAISATHRQWITQ